VINGDPSQPSPYDFPVILNKQVAAYLDLFQNKQRKTFQNWLNRSGRYQSIMETRLEKSGLPTDLIYLSMIESGYNQRALSHANAVGLWQFIGSTGKMYNLTIDKYLDERRDADKSTGAAASFLGDLYRDFGDWHLAVAAYNCGPAKIKNGMEKYQVDNFWDLAKTDFLPLETKRYVPKLIAAIIIARQPEKFGFDKVALEKPLEFDTLTVGPGLSLDAVSIIAGTDTSIIKDLNAELRTGKTPANQSSYAVKIPPGTKEIASHNMKRLHTYASTDFKTHVIKKGDTLARICKIYDINTTTLLKVNNLRSSRLKPGTNLRIPFTNVKYQLLPEGSETMLAGYKENLILHRIKKGETISAISRKYHVPTELILSWNGLKSAKSIKVGQQLALYVEGAGKTTNESIALQKKGTTTLILASTTKLKKSTGSTARKAAPSRLLNDRDPALALATKISPKITPKKLAKSIQIESPADPYDMYQVKSGDSLWAISRKFKVSTKQIKEWNKLTSDQLKPGSQLKMKKV
jgi:membrane-bound lytic murein transglycosylase D